MATNQGQGSLRSLIIAGNWKMNNSVKESELLTKALLTGLKEQEIDLPAIVLFPPFTSLYKVIEVTKGTKIDVGAQNMDYRESGAFTGEISAAMIKDIGATYVLIGHSERRQFFGDTNQLVNLKLKAALKQGLQPIVCVGESADERETELTDSVICRQVAAALSDIKQAELASLVIAYEPVWAIGTGKTCDSNEANRVAKLIRQTLSNLYNDSQFGDTVPILYGGSVKSSTIEDQLSKSDVDGALVGGASLTADEFLSIIKAAQKKVRLSLSKA